MSDNRWRWTASPPVNHRAVAINERLIEVPGYVVSVLRVGLARGQMCKERVYAAAPDIDHRE